MAGKLDHDRGFGMKKRYILEWAVQNRRMRYRASLLKSLLSVFFQREPISIARAHRMARATAKPHP